LRPMLKTDKNTTALICTSRAKKNNKKKNHQHQFDTYRED